MTKKEVCLKYQVIGGWNISYYALEVHHIEYGIDEYVYCHCTLGDTYHKLKVYTSPSGKSYVLFNHRRFYMDSCCYYKFSQVF